MKAAVLHNYDRELAGSQFVVYEHVPDPNSPLKKSPNQL